MRALRAAPAVDAVDADAEPDPVLEGEPVVESVWFPEPEPEPEPAEPEGVLAEPDADGPVPEGAWPEEPGPEETGPAAEPRPEPEGAALEVCSPDGSVEAAVSLGPGVGVPTSPEPPPEAALAGLLGAAADVLGSGVEGDDVDEPVPDEPDEPDELDDDGQVRLKSGVVSEMLLEMPNASPASWYLKSKVRERRACFCCSLYIPPSVDLAEQKATTNLIPISFSILSGWDSLILGGAGKWPASLGNPDRLALRRGLSCLQGRVKERIAVADVIGHGVLEVWIRVHSQEIAGRNDGIVGAIDPSSPRVNVTDWNARDTGIAESGSNLTNVVDNIGWFGTDTSLVGNAGGRDTIEILRANRNTLNQVGEA